MKNTITATYRGVTDDEGKLTKMMFTAKGFKSLAEAQVFVDRFPAWTQVRTGRIIVNDKDALSFGAFCYVKFNTNPHTPDKNKHALKKVALLMSNGNWKFDESSALIQNSASEILIRETVCLGQPEIIKERDESQQWIRDMIIKNGYAKFPIPSEVQNSQVGLKHGRIERIDQKNSNKHSFV